MPTSQISEVVQQLRKAALRHEGAGLTDGQLLGRFLEQRDEAAFTALVRRHAAMVWGVCRRLLPHHPDAEDAFQATFLVLVRKAASVVPREMVGNWLYGVANQTALKARATAARQRTRERQVTPMPEPALEPDPWHDLEPVLDQELSRLPDRYRAAVVLCDLEGKTRKEAARQLGCPEGTVASRLATARKMLAKRLARHGLALSGGTLSAVLAQNAASACAPASVVSGTIKAGTLVAAGQAAAAGAIPGKVAALTEGVLRAMFLTKLKVLTAVLVIATLGGVAGLIYQTLAAGQPKAQGAIAKAGSDNRSAAKEDEKPRPDEGGRPKGAPRKDKPKKEGGTREIIIEAKPPKISAEKLAEAFGANQADADERFEGKWVEVTGTLVRVFRAPAGFASRKGVPDYVVELSSGDKKSGKMPLQFLFAAPDKKQLAGMEPHRTVTIRAYCRGLVPGVITPEGTKKGKSLHFWRSKVIAAKRDS
jgi:RNA polymerase sigma factor (sigma-70 family)